METQKKIRDQEIDMDMKIDLVRISNFVLKSFVRTSSVQELLGLHILS